MICLGLYDVHKKEIVHRNLKPSNILCKRSYEKELFKIADFSSSYIPAYRVETTIKEILTDFYVPIE